MKWGGFQALSAAWLALLLVPLIAFYFLKLKRPRIQVPSLVLWRQVLQDQRVNSPFQRFKRNLLLLLQIILLMLLVLAAMQPFWRGRPTSVRRWPVLLDNSASMAALDKAGGSSRLAAAKDRVRALIDGLTGDQELCLISFSGAARKRTGFTTDKRLLRQALDEIEVEDLPSDLEDALRLTQALARSTTFDEVLLFSDGNFPARANFDLPFQVNYQKLDPAGPNFGITALSARRATGGGWDVFAQLDGSATAESAATVTLTQDGQPAGTERVTLTRGRGERLVFRVRSENPAMLEVKLAPDAFDSLPADNVATLELPVARPLRVFVAPALATYRHAFRGMTGMDLGTDEKATFDLVVSDRATDVGIAAGTRLWVGVVPPALTSVITLATNGTQVVDWRRDAPVLQHVQLADLVIMDRPQYQVGTGEGDVEQQEFTVLVHGHRGPLLVEQRGRDQLTYALLFHSDRSTWPYRAGFPIFVANVAQAALEQAGIAEKRATPTGPLAPRVGPGASLVSASETMLAAAEEIQFNEKLKVAVAGTPVKQDKPLWWALTAVALGVLVAEWWLFQRRRGG